MEKPFHGRCSVYEADERISDSSEIVVEVVRACEEYHLDARHAAK